jgi:hypothetical protein
MKIKLNVCLLIGFALCAVLSAKAQSTYVTFSVNMGTNIALGTFDSSSQTVEVQGNFEGWASGDTLIEEGSSGIYTNTFGVSDSSIIEGTTNAQIQYEFVIEPGKTYESTYDGANRSALIPINPSPASFVLPTPFFDDDGAPVTNQVTFNVDMQEQSYLGTFPSGGYVTIPGNFNGWDSSLDQLTNDPVNTNVWEGTFPLIVSPNAAVDFKYYGNPSPTWEEPDAVNSDSGGNRFFAAATETLPLVYYSDEAPAPNCTLTLSVDMSVVTAEDPYFEPSTVVLWGSFNGWGEGLSCTNNPSAANPNIYSTVISAPEGSSFDDQFRYIQSYSDGTVYDYPTAVEGLSGSAYNRVVTVPNVTATNLTVLFDGAEFDDYLSAPVNVTFMVDMTPATEENLTNYYDTSVVFAPFNPSTDAVYVNGQFCGPLGNFYYWYLWSDGEYGTEPAPGYPNSGFELNRVGSSLIYSNTITLSAGTPVELEYEYGTDPGGQNQGPVQDEPAYGAMDSNYSGTPVAHVRIIRNTSTGAYNLPEDTFGDVYYEPEINAYYLSGANLTVGSATNGTVPITWLGRPGAELQSSTSLLGNWQTIAATDGTNWNVGFYSINGFVSKTNWPANTATFFRVVKY